MQFCMVGDEPEAAAILKQMRAAGMKQRAFGEFRTLATPLLKEAAMRRRDSKRWYPYDPTPPTRAGWISTERLRRASRKAGTVCVDGFDTMNALLDSICKAG